MFGHQVDDEPTHRNFHPFQKLVVWSSKYKNKNSKSIYTFPIDIQTPEVQYLDPPDIPKPKTPSYSKGMARCQGMAGCKNKAHIGSWDVS